jgi:hypothetical protein
MSDQMYALWEDVEKRILEAAESELLEHDETEGPLLPAQVKWAQATAKKIADHAMNHLDGYTAEDITNGDVIT